MTSWNHNLRTLTLWTTVRRAEIPIYRLHFSKAPDGLNGEHIKVGRRETVGIQNSSLQELREEPLGLGPAIQAVGDYLRWRANLFPPTCYKEYWLLTLVR